MPESHHDHLIDVQSGSVIEFRNEEIEKLQRRVAEELGFELVDHRLELYGVPKGKKPQVLMPTIRAVFVLTVFLAVTFILIPLQWLFADVEICPRGAPFRIAITVLSRSCSASGFASLGKPPAGQRRAASGQSHRLAGHRDFFGRDAAFLCRQIGSESAGRSSAPWRGCSALCLSPAPDAARPARRATTIRDVCWPGRRAGAVPGRHLQRRQHRAAVQERAAGRGGHGAASAAAMSRCSRFPPPMSACMAFPWGAKTARFLPGMATWNWCRICGKR